MPTTMKKKTHDPSLALLWRRRRILVPIASLQCLAGRKAGRQIDNAQRPRGEIEIKHRRDVDGARRGNIEKIQPDLCPSLMYLHRKIRFSQRQSQKH